MLDVDTFKTRINNFLDHSNLGESNIYFPVTVDGALVRAWEMTVRSPEVTVNGRNLGRFHLAYSNQIAEQRGNLTGGLICAPAGSPDCDAGFDYEPVDHDQRNTLNTGFTARLPYRSWFSSNVYYGSGFTNGLAATRPMAALTRVHICPRTPPLTWRLAQSSARTGSCRLTWST